MMCAMFDSMIEFSPIFILYITAEKYKKYKTVDICPNSINGDSTCLAPNCINTKKLATNIKKNALFNGLNCIPLDLLTSVIGNSNSIRMAENIAITPNSLLGIDLNMA
jgi:S-methylmethionine-dependent homocysteine/selenocysteine methylase